MKWIIIFCCYFGNATEPDGKLIISETKVEAFGKTWDVVPLHNTFLENGSNGVRRAMLVLETTENNQKITAVLTITGPTITFSIPGVEVATMVQQPHSNNTIEE